MAEATDTPSAAPKLHGTFILTRLAGAGVALEDLATEEQPDHVVLEIGDSATNLALDGTLDEVQSLITEACAQLARLRGSPARHGATAPTAADFATAGDVVLAWLAHTDEPACAGVVDLINAVRVVDEPAIGPRSPATTRAVDEPWQP